jgi:hypothetical protein
MYKSIIIGAGGLGRHIESNIKQFNLGKLEFCGHFDKNRKLKTKYNEKNIFNKISKNDFYFINGIGNFSYKWYPNIFLKYKKKFKFINLIHKSSIISNKVKFGIGTNFMENCIVKSYSIKLFFENY